MAFKGITSILHALDSQGNFLCFFAAKNQYRMEIQFKIAWITLCTHVFHLQVLLTDNPLDQFRDWSLPSSAQN